MRTRTTNPKPIRLGICLYLAIAAACEQRNGGGHQPAASSQASAFDAALAAEGQAIHDRLLHAEHVDEFYVGGGLFGAVTDDIVASIEVPEDAWNELTTVERLRLMHYAASLIEPMRSHPERYTTIPTTAPGFKIVLQKVSMLTTRSWVIFAGRLQTGNNAKYDILMDHIVASGKNTSLR